MSRTKARQQFRAPTLVADIAERGIYVRSVSRGARTEEAGAAYKNIDEVVEAVRSATGGAAVLARKLLQVWSQVPNGSGW
jgi:RNA-splicing ligase RtcB